MMRENEILVFTIIQLGSESECGSTSTVLTLILYRSEQKVITKMRQLNAHICYQLTKHKTNTCTMNIKLTQMTIRFDLELIPLNVDVT